MELRIQGEGVSAVIAPGESVQFEAYEGNTGLSGVTFSVVSGPAGINASGGLLTCNTDAQDGAAIKVGAALAGYTCEDFTLTVAVTPPIEAPVIAYAGHQDKEAVDTVAPGTSLPLGIYLNKQAVSGAAFSVVSGPATIDAATGRLTCKADAQEGEVIKVRAVHEAYDDIADYTLTVEPVWNKKPRIVKTFFDDFSAGLRPAVWDACNQSWGVGNNGVRPYNTFYSSDAAVAAAEGVDSGGILVLRSQGDLSPEANRNRSGSAIISREAFGPGLYEVRTKVVPRMGQCSAMWTYWNGGGNTVETNKYSEIDIEMPMAANYTKWSGTTYKRFAGWDVLAERATYEQSKPDGANDGQWHTWAFEWRTDDANGDNKVVWYLDGEKMFEILNYTPEYTATFWIGNWFPEDRGWVGVADFDYAYMYVDWVRITGYSDPVKPGAISLATPGNVGNDLGNNPIPQNQYIANSRFERVSGGNFVGWDKTGTVMQGSGKSAVLNENSTLKQTVNAQFSGYSFDLSVNANVTSGSGKLKLYVQYMSGTVSLGRSDDLIFDATAAQDKTLRFIIPELRLGSNTVTAVRVVAETEAGTTAEVHKAEMFMKK
jgi:hypothetical protein